MRDALSLLDRAVATLGRPDDAVREFEAALALRPDSTEALKDEAIVFLQQKDGPRAVKRVNDQITKVPGNASLYALLGSVYEAGGNASKAEEAYYRAIATDPKVVTPYLLLGGLYARAHGYTMATQKYEEAIRLNPRLLPGYVLLSVMYEQQGNVARSRQYLEQALKIDATFAPAANNLAFSLVEHGGDVNRAVALAETAYRQTPADPHVMDTLGWIYLKKGLPQRALPLLQTSAGRLPNDAVVHYHLGLAYYRLGNTDMARRELHRALATGQDFGQVDEVRRTLASLGG